MKKDCSHLDPLEEIRATREEINRKFKTVGEYCAYLRTRYPEHVSARPIKQKAGNLNSMTHNGKKRKKSSPAAAL
jgi:hypothetical protein